MSDLGGCLLWGVSAPGGVPGPGRVYQVPGSICPRGVLWAGVFVLGGVSAPCGGCLLQGGVPGPRGSAPGQVLPPLDKLWGAPGQVLTPVDKMKHSFCQLRYLTEKVELNASRAHNNS